VGRGPAHDLRGDGERLNEKRTLLPCATCPWRIEKGVETIPAYSQEAALALRNTVGDGDGLRNIMACHHSTRDAPISCRGYLAQVGWTNINVRILLARRKLPRLDRIVEACEQAGIKLHRNYGEMMDKLTLSYERMLHTIRGRLTEGRAPAKSRSARGTRRI
jgi:hypothetical protein